MNSPKPTYLRLLPLPNEPQMTAAQMYGRIFTAYAEQVSDLKKYARDLMIDALDKGIDPTSFNADFSLVDLDLAQMGLTFDGKDVTITFVDPRLEGPAIIVNNDEEE